jgi:antitoxin (DNA-binding transcriptional repressor) of toxin-antitoxin stability system
MHQVNLQAAVIHLAKLIEAAASGEDVVITHNDGATFKLVPIPSTKPHPVFGSANGLVSLSADFDQPLDDFKDYAP